MGGGADVVKGGGGGDAGYRSSMNEWEILSAEGGRVGWVVRARCFPLSFFTFLLCCFALFFDVFLLLGF